jgi:hypothetical protein
MTDSTSIYCKDKHRCLYPRCFYKRLEDEDSCDLHIFYEHKVKCNTKDCNGEGPRCWKCRQKDRYTSHGYDIYNRGYFISPTDFCCNKKTRCKLYSRHGIWCTTHEKCLECGGPRDLKTLFMRCSECRCSNELCGRSAKTCTRHNP